MDKRIFLVVIFLLMIGGITSSVLAADIRNGLTEDLAVRLLNNIVWALLGVVGVASIFAVLYSGFLFMTSGGDEKTLEEAKTFLKYAIIGVIMAALSFSVTSIISSLV